MERFRGREAITVAKDLAAWAEIKAAWDPVVLVEIRVIGAQAVRRQIQVEQTVAAPARLMG
jgi:hypothetical protein